MTLAAAVRWLATLQHRAGSWTDFLLAPGPSDGWVTGYVGTALALAADDPRLPGSARSLAAAAADAGARWLLTADSGSGGWGWTAGVRADADSTAWAVRLLALRRWPVPPPALTFLAEHRGEDGYRTYRSPDLSGSWAAPTPEVTAAVLLARHAAGALDRVGLAAQWCALIAPARRPDGRWQSMWWPDAAYPTAVVGSSWLAAGRPPLPGAVSLAASGGPASGLASGPASGLASAWGLATRLWAAAAFDADHRLGLARTLLAEQRRDGGWPGGAVLRVPAQRSAGPPRLTRDARGIFTTATAVHALLAGGVGLDEPRRPVSRRPRPRRPVSGSPVSGSSVSGSSVPGSPGPRRSYDGVVGDMAAAAGVDRSVALPVFRALTRESLARAGVWPARQLSNLAGGTPLEFSVGSAPALRLTTEVGDPVLPPLTRVRSGLRAIERTASLLGMQPAWRAALPAIAVLADPELPVPDGCRFWAWAGVDLAPHGGAVLKTYLSLHAEDLAGWPARESSFLAACGVSRQAQVHAVLDRLRQDGWCHEVGVGLTGGAGWGIKIYYELAGYRPSAVRDVLAICGLDTDLDGLAPEVPGVLRASLAAKRRSGIATRVHPATGRVDEVTVAAAFPAPLVGRELLAARVSSWLAAVGSIGPHDAAVAVLAPTWRCAPPLARMHSLLTRSRSAHGDQTKVYLRPWLGPDGVDSP